MSDIISLGDIPGTKLTLVGDEIPFGAYQAVYHKLTKRVERGQKFYEGAYEVDFGNLDNLHNRLIQSTRQYQVKASRFEVTHAIKGEGTRYHSSYEKFKITGLTSSACTQRLSYEFDFLIVLPPEVEEANEIAQRYKLTIVLDQDLADEPNVPFFFSRLPDTINLQLNIEFSDYAVYQHLRAVVDEWVAGLPKRTPHRLLTVARKAEKYARPMLTSLVFTAALLAGYFSIGNILETNIIGAIKVLTLSLIFAFVSNDIIGLLIEIFSKFASKLYPVTYLKFTTGDNDRQNKVSLQRQYSLRVLSFVIFGIVFVVTLNVLSSYVYDYLVRP